MVTVEKQRKETGSRATVAALDHLSGPSVGLQTLLFSRELDVHLNPDRFLHVTKSGKPVEKKPGSELIARLVRTSDSYQLEACNNASIWINGRKIDSGELHHDDIVEFGEKGPLSRFRLLNSSTHQRRYFSQVCDDCWDYIRTSRKPVYSRLAKAFGEGAHRIAAGSTILFRATVLITLLLLGLVTYQQYNINEMQQAALTASQGQIDDFSQTLARAREEALTPNDLEELKDVLSRDLSASSSRLDALEKGTAATQTVIRNTSSKLYFCWVLTVIAKYLAGE